MELMVILSLLALAGGLYIALPVVLIEIWRRKRRLSRIYSEQKAKKGAKVSVIFAAQNEEKHIARTLDSLVVQDYPDLEIIVVNDRSDDQTGDIIRRYAADCERVTAIMIEDLPEGWLGKCNALREGMTRSSGEWLLFTDADVEFDPQAVSQAIASSEVLGADHLVLFPRLLWHGPMEAGLLAFFTMMLGVGFQFWRVESSSLHAYVGIGAFNMIRRSLYQRFGGHHPLRLEIADDMKLGYLAKKYGGQSVALYGDGEVRVRWREGAGDVVRGIIRSGFPGINFNWLRLTFGVIGISLVFIVPFFLLLINPSPVVALLSGLTVLLGIVSVGLTAYSQQIPLWTTLLYPFSAALFVCGLLLSALVTTIKGGVQWRNTFYSVKELKKGSVK